jgi:hypothetical protein
MQISNGAGCGRLRFSKFAAFEFVSEFVLRFSCFPTGRNSCLGFCAYALVLPTSIDLLIHPLAQRVIEDLVAFLHAMRDAGGDDQLDIAAPAAFAAVFAEEGDGE